MAGPQTVIADARRHRARYLEELKEFVRFPSISAEPARAPDLERCAGWLVRHLRSMGLTSARVIPTAGHPLVLATTRKVPGRRTLLVYGHYDVQPTDPLSEWWTPPFCPTVRAGALYGRGASDDKGQLFAHLKALESYLRAAGEMPVNLICLIEGEEEVGSPGLTRFLRAQGRRLGADAVVVSDMPMAGPGRPAITYAMRGALSLQLDVRGPARDLHSGLYGGAVHNPAQALAEIITGLHRPDGRVAVPGFYRDVRRWSARERAYMRRVGPNDGRLAANGKIRTAWGEPGFTLYEPRRQGRHPGAGDRQARLEAGPRPGPGRDRAADRPANRGPDAGDGDGQPSNGIRSRAGAGRPRRAGRARRLRRPRARVRHCPRIRSPRRNHSSRQHNAARARRSDRPDGIRPTGRRHACPQREVSPGQFLPRHRDRGLVPGRAGKPCLQLSRPWASSSAR